MLKSRYGISGLLKSDAADVQVVTDSNMLLNEVAYQLRNPYKARMTNPFSYPWAPFEVYFNPYLSNLRGDRFRSYRSRPYNEACGWESRKFLSIRRL